jgi:hypothetical protein
LIHLDLQQTSPYIQSKEDTNPRSRGKNHEIRIISKTLYLDYLEGRANCVCSSVNGTRNHTISISSSYHAGTKIVHILYQNVVSLL